MPTNEGMQAEYEDECEDEGDDEGWGCEEGLYGVHSCGSMEMRNETLIEEGGTMGLRLEKEPSFP